MVLMKPGSALRRISRQNINIYHPLLVLYAKGQNTQEEYSDRHDSHVRRGVLIADLFHSDHEIQATGIRVH